MSYRDDGDGLRLRIEQLEGQLEDAEATISKLKGIAPPSATLSEKLHGGPFEVEVERSVPGQLDDDALGAVSEAIERVYRRGGNVAHVGRRFTWRRDTTSSDSRQVDFSVSERDGAIQIGGRDHDKGGLIGAFWGAVFTVATLALVAVLLATKQGGSPALWGTMSTAFTVAMAAAMRSFNQRRVRARARKMTATVDDIEQVLREHPVRFAVDDDAELEAAELEAAEAEAAEDGQRRRL